MIEFIHGDQGTEAWFKLRLGSIGGSSASDLLAGGAGKTRKKLMRRLAGEILTGTNTPTFTSPAMEEGSRREAESRDFLSFHIGEEIQECSVITNSDIPGCHYSPDGYIPESKTLIELKNPIPTTQIELLETEKIPKKYMDQMNHGILISGYDRCVFCSYVPGIRPFIQTVERDEKKIDELKDAIEVFVAELETLVEKLR